MEKEIVLKRMKELEDKIKFKFKELELLSLAMSSIKLLEDGKNYENEPLAIVGDSVLKTVLCEHFYLLGKKTKKEINDLKKPLEENVTLHSVVMNEGIINFAYNNNHFYDDENVPQNEKVVSKKHDSYLEAIIGAVFIDSGYEKARDWIISYLLPLLEKRSVEE